MITVISRACFDQIWSIEISLQSARRRGHHCQAEPLRQEDAGFCATFAARLCPFPPAVCALPPTYMSRNKQATCVASSKNGRRLACSCPPCPSSPRSPAHLLDLPLAQSFCQLCALRPIQRASRSPCPWIRRISHALPPEHTGSCRSRPERLCH